MATVDDVKTALVNKLETSIASASPEQLAYIAKAVNSIEPPIAWSIKDSDFSSANYNGYFVDTTNGEVTITLPSVSGNTTGDGRVNIVDLKQNFQTNHLVITSSEIDDYIANAQLRLREKIGDFSHEMAIMGVMACLGFAKIGDSSRILDA